jgi:hypothetical protein
MWFHSVLDSLKSGPARTRAGRPRRGAPRKRPTTCKLHLELLEGRAVPSNISLVPSEAAPQLVGERITWTATVSDGPADGLVYQFSDGPVHGPIHVVRDFSPDNHFTWTPMEEGRYQIMVTVKQGYDATDTESAVVRDLVNSRVTGADAVITPTLNPLVALYSVPPGPRGTVHVEFAVAGDHPSWRSTDDRPSVPGESTNFDVAGMLPNTTYQMRHVFTHHHHQHISSPLLFTTGGIPSTLTFPTLTVRLPPGPQSDLDQDLIYHTLPTNPMPFVTDLQGRVVWYFDVQQSGLGIRSFGTGSFVPGGTVLGFGRDRNSVRNNQDVLREIDLAGDPVRETNLAAVNAQLTALGHEISYGFHHDVQRLPNGDTVVLGLTERKIDINGTPTNYIGDLIVVLDEDLQVTWVWDAFDHLDVNRGPVLGEIVQEGDGGPDSVVPDYPAVSWLHDNAVSLAPVDGNLILSERHQDWVIKIDYENGGGDGHVIWRLGQKDGNFTLNNPTNDPNPWFSHQHNAHFIDDTTLILFDNGNTRRVSDPNAHSRGQVWRLDEQTMTATLLLNADLGNSSDALGAAQRLSNGNLSFTSGFQGQPPNQFGQTIEVLPDGTKSYVLEVNLIEYRSYRIRTLYEGISDQLSTGGGAAQATTTPVTRYSPALAVAGDFHVAKGVMHPGNGSVTSAVPIGTFPLQLWSSVATLTTSAKPPANWTTPWSSGVGMVLPLHGMWEDELLAAATGEDGGLAISLAKHNPRSMADDPWAAVVGTDVAMGDWPFLAAPRD